MKCILNHFKKYIRPYKNMDAKKGGEKNSLPPCVQNPQGKFPNVDHPFKIPLFFYWFSMVTKSWAKIGRISPTHPVLQSTFKHPCVSQDNTLALSLSRTHTHTHTHTHRSRRLIWCFRISPSGPQSFPHLSTHQKLNSVPSRVFLLKGWTFERLTWWRVGGGG